MVRLQDAPELRAGSTPPSRIYQGAQLLGQEVMSANYAESPFGIAQLPAYTSGESRTANEVVADHPLGYTRAQRVTFSTGNANAGVKLGLTAFPVGTVLSMTVWVKALGGSNLGNYGFGAIGLIAGPVETLILNTWVQYSWNYTVGGVTTRQIGFRRGSSGATGDFLITGMQLEISPSLGPLFSGATANTPGNRYFWQGTTEASPSIRQNWVWS